MTGADKGRFNSNNKSMKQSEEITCKTGLKKNVIKRQVFDGEIALCKKLSAENNGSCGWGVCRNCGVIPLLYKLHKGILLEDKKDIVDAKLKILN